MFGGMVIQKKVYNRFDFMSVTLMTFGLIFFTIADQKASPNFNMIGVALISAALMADAVIGNVQEKMMREYKDGILIVYMIELYIKEKIYAKLF